MSLYCMLEWNKITVKDMFLSHKSVLLNYSGKLSPSVSVEEWISFNGAGSSAQNKYKLELYFKCIVPLTSRLFMRQGHCLQSINGAHCTKTNRHHRVDILLLNVSLHWSI